MASDVCVRLKQVGNRNEEPRVLSRIATLGKRQLDVSLAWLMHLDLR
jgi:hypothetical protein